MITNAGSITTTATFPPIANQPPEQERAIISVPTVAPFKPTPQQESYLLSRLTPITKAVPSREHLSRRLHVSVEEINKWHENKDFSDWFSGKVNLYLAEELIVIYGALFKKAKSGNVPAIELYLKRNDKAYQAFLGKIDLSIRSTATPVSPEEMARAVVKEVKTNPEFRKLLGHELSNEGEIISVGQGEGKDGEIIDVDQLDKLVGEEKDGTVCPADSNDRIV